MRQVLIEGELAVRVLDDAEGDLVAACDALQDGEYLARIGVNTLSVVEDATQALLGALWACELFRVDGGWVAFESVAGALIWRAQA